MAVRPPMPAEEVDEEQQAEEVDEEQQAEEVDRMAERLADVENLTQICTTGLGAAISYAEAARAMLHEAAALLREATDAAETIVADVFAVVPPGADPLLEATAAAAAKLVASLFAERPLLPGAISAAADHVASLFSFLPPVVGPLLGARHELRLLVDNHWSAGFLFTLCALGLGTQPATVAWRSHHEHAIHQANEAHLWLTTAVWQAVAAEHAHRLCLDQSPRHGEHMSEAEQILRSAVEELDAALVALLRMRDAVALEEQVLRYVIDHVMDAP